MRLVSWKILILILILGYPRFLSLLEGKGNASQKYQEQRNMWSDGQGCPLQQFAGILCRRGTIYSPSEVSISQFPTRAKPFSYSLLLPYPISCLAFMNYDGKLARAPRSLLTCVTFLLSSSSTINGYLFLSFYSLHSRVNSIFLHFLGKTCRG